MIRAERGRAAGAIACALALAVGCGSQAPAPAAPPTPAPAPAPSGATPEALTGLEQALAQLASAGAPSAHALVTAIAAAVAPVDECLTSFGDGGNPPAAVCPAPADHDVTLAQRVLDHAGKALATAYAGADTGALEKQLAALPVRLPLPAFSSVCDLQVVEGADLTNDVGRTYVILGADQSLRAGRAPMATVRVGGVDVRADRGAPFPGDEVAPAQGNGAVADTSKLAAAVARLRGGAAGAPAGEEKNEPPADASGAKLPLAEAPVLLFVDRQAGAVDAALVADALLWSQLAVAGPDGNAAALPVHLRVAPPGENGPQPVVALTAENVLVAVSNAPGVSKLARVPDGSAAPAGLADALKAARAKAPPSAEVHLLVDGPASVGELAQILAAVHSAGVDAVTIAVGPLETAPEAKPSVRITGVKVKGRLSAPAVEKALNHHRDDMLACFADQLKVNPELAGIVTVSFIVAPTGRSAGARAKGVDPQVDDCIGKVTDTFRFPHPKGAASVSYKLVFSRTGG